MNTAVKTWSPYQEAIFRFVENEPAEGAPRSAIAVAVAGSGKSTTIKEAFRRVRGSSVFLAFNRAIADSLAKEGVNAMTFHAMTRGPVMEALGLDTRRRDTVQADKLRFLVDENMGDRDCMMYGAFICKLVGLARQSGFGCLMEATKEAWQALIDRHDLELQFEEATFDRAIQFAEKLLGWSNACRTMIDFDDMLYFAVKEGVSLKKYDWVFVDEAQDTNAIQRALLRKIMKPSTRMVAVGDPAQAIYGFRGADSESMNMIAEEFGCCRLPLTVSYRCPTAVIEFAQQWVEHIEPAPNAPRGEVTELGKKFNEKIFSPHELVVCRTTAPMIKMAYRLLKARVPARVMGREIGAGILALIKKMRATDIESLVTRLETFTERETQKAIAKKQESKAEAIQDKTDTVLFLIDTLTEDDRTIEALTAAVNALFADKANAVVLSTIHKAKGLEADTVYWLNSSQCPAKWAKQEWQQEQERNLCYVATTRAMRRLILIEI